MSFIDRLFGHGEPDLTQGGARADSDMRRVIEAHLEMNPLPIEILPPQTARRQPTAADAAMKVAHERRLDRTADLKVLTEDIVIPGPGGPLDARIYRKHESEKLRPAVVYFHGGGWVLGDLDACDASARVMARLGDFVVVSVHYRLAPEDPFPAAHEDAFAAYEWVRDNAQAFGGDPQRVAVMGEGAGGALAAGVALMARDFGVEPPSHMALICPIAGIDMNTPSYVENAHARPLSRPIMAWFMKHAFADPADMHDPLVNLVDADLRGLPSATVVTAEIDPLCSEGETLAHQLEAQGVEVRHKTFHGVTHAFFGMGLVVKDAAAAEIFVTHDLKRAFRTPVVVI